MERRSCSFSCSTALFCSLETMLSFLPSFLFFLPFFSSFFQLSEQNSFSSYNPPSFTLKLQALRLFKEGKESSGISSNPPFASHMSASVPSQEKYSILILFVNLQCYPFFLVIVQIICFCFS